MNCIFRLSSLLPVQAAGSSHCYQQLVLAIYCLASLLKAYPLISAKPSAVIVSHKRVILFFFDGLLHLYFNKVEIEFCSENWRLQLLVKLHRCSHREFSSRYTKTFVEFCVLKM